MFFNFDGKRGIKSLYTEVKRKESQGLEVGLDRFFCWFGSLGDWSIAVFLLRGADSIGPLSWVVFSAF